MGPVGPPADVALTKGNSTPTEGALSTEKAKNILKTRLHLPRRRPTWIC